MPIGIVDTPDDWDATAIALALQYPELHGLDSAAFLWGFKLGFLVGHAQAGGAQGAQAAQAWLQATTR